MTDSRDSNEALIERREFLKTGTLAGAAALIAPAGVTEAQTQTGAAEQPITTPIMTAEVLKKSWSLATSPCQSQRIAIARPHLNDFLTHRGK